MNDIEQILNRLTAGITSVPDNIGKLLITRTAEGMVRRGVAKNEEYIQRAIHELNIILGMKFPNYFMIVEDDICHPAELVGHLSDEDYASVMDQTKRLYTLADALNRGQIAENDREEAVNFVNSYWKKVIEFMEQHQTMPGMTKGPGRGSAAGSLVTFCLGITDIDPIKNGLLFERFLNPERVSMPDIDTDIASADMPYGARDIVIAYLTSKYGSKGICGIATPSTLAPKAAVKAMARVQGSRRFKSMIDQSKRNKQNVADEFLRYGNRLADAVPKSPKISFSSNVSTTPDKVVTLEESLYNTVEEMEKNGEIGSHEKEDLNKIIEMAVKAEGLNVHYGRHACGMIIVDNGDVAQYAPQMMDTQTGTLKIQMDAEAAEAKGFLKMDLLALKELNKITKCIRLVYENRGIYLDEKKFPQEPEVYKKIFAAANTNEVFQFESRGMKQMLKEFEPETFEDITLLVACFRPGPMQYLPGIIARKHGRKAEENAVTRIASYSREFEAIVKPTYYALVYQEQIMQTFRTLAGYSMGGADNVRRAMGHKKMDILVAEKHNFVYGNPEKNISGAVANGIKESDALDLFDEMIEFAKYSFNKSHACAYAYTAYITAWLKFHYPSEFYASVLSMVSDKKKYEPLLAEAREMGLETKGPDINLSESGFTGRGNVIRFGFSGIKGLGNAINPILEMHRKGDPAFRDFTDFMLRTDVTYSTVNLLTNAGAFDSFGLSRDAIRSSMDDFFVQKNVIQKNGKEKERNEAMLQDLKDHPEKPLDRVKWKIKAKHLPTEEKLLQKIKKEDDAIEAARLQMQMVTYNTNMLSDRLSDLEKEKDLLGVYISGHPLDAYGKAEDHHAVTIGDAGTGPCRLFGIITNLRHSKRKVDGKPMAFFTLEDPSGTIDVKVFTDSFATNGGRLKEGDAVVLSGVIRADNNSDNGGEEDNVSYSFTLDKTDAVEIVRPELETVEMEVTRFKYLPEAVHKLDEFKISPDDQNARKVKIFIKDTGEIATFKSTVSQNVKKICTPRYMVL